MADHPGPQGGARGRLRLPRRRSRAPRRPARPPGRRGSTRRSARSSSRSTRTRRPAGRRPAQAATSSSGSTARPSTTATTSSASVGAAADGGPSAVSFYREDKPRTAERRRSAAASCRAPPSPARAAGSAGAGSLLGADSRRQWDFGAAQAPGGRADGPRRSSPSSPARQAGRRPGSVITAVAGKPVRDVTDLQQRPQRHPARADWALEITEATGSRSRRRSPATERANTNHEAVEGHEGGDRRLRALRDFVRSIAFCRLNPRSGP